MSKSKTVANIGRYIDVTHKLLLLLSKTWKFLKFRILVRFVEAMDSNQLSDVLKMVKPNLLYQITIFYSEWSDELENSIKALDDLTNVSRQFIFISTIMKNKEEKIRFVF